VSGSSSSSRPDLAHFAVIAPPLPGHFNPLLALGEELAARGHRITFVGQPDAAKLVRGEGTGFAAVGETSHPPGSLDARIGRMARLNGAFGMRGMIRDVAHLTDMLCREAPGALRKIGADAVVADQMEAAGGLVAEHLGLPFVTTATGLPINREPGVPPPYVPWGFRPGEQGEKRNVGGYRISDWLMRGVGDVIEHHSRRFGLTPRRRAEDCFSPFAQLAQAVPRIDFPRSHLPDSFHYLGPFRSDREEEWTPPAGDDRPLVFCSLGTLQGSRASIFRKVAQAAEALGLRLVLAHGGRLPPREVEGLPGDPLVYDFVPQRAVLARAAIAVTHAGFNTVLDALSVGVPLVALPLAFEQPATAARLRHAGVAEVVGKRATARKLAKAMERLLEDATYRERAAGARAEIERAGGAGQAADLAEACLQLPSPRTRAGRKD
jgi:UDP:flavonoid glycosyltransferase YjiC (YdhE family)